MTVGTMEKRMANLTFRLTWHPERVDILDAADRLWAAAGSRD